MVQGVDVNVRISRTLVASLFTCLLNMGCIVDNPNTRTDMPTNDAGLSNVDGGVQCQTTCDSSACPSGMVTQIALASACVIRSVMKSAPRSNVKLDKHLSSPMVNAARYVLIYVFQTTIANLMTFVLMRGSACQGASCAASAKKVR